MDKTARPQVELPGSDIDVMRDIYMTGTQRKAFDSILARLAESEARAEGLVKLLREVSDWIDNWEPNFADDAEWQPVAERITAAIAQEAEREAGSA